MMRSIQSLLTPILHAYGRSTFQLPLPFHFHFQLWGPSNFHFHPGFFRTRKWKVAGRSGNPHKVLPNADNLAGGELISDPAEVAPVVGRVSVEDIPAAKFVAPFVEGCHLDANG